MKAALLATMMTLGSLQAAAKEPREERGPSPSEAPRDDSNVSPRAQSLGRDQSGVFVNSAATNSGYSPSFVMRGFPDGLTLFDGAARGFTSQDVDLSTVDHVEFYKGPSAMLFGKALGGYGGAANYVRKTPTEAVFVQGVATIGGFGVHRLTIDANAPLNENKNLLFRFTGSVQRVGSFVNFVRARSYDIASVVTMIADNGDRITLRAEYNQARLVYRDGVPAAPIFLHVPKNFYAGAPVNEQEAPQYGDFTLTHEHVFDKDWSLSTVVDYFVAGNRWGWHTGWGYDDFRTVTLGHPARTNHALRNFDAQIRLHGRFETGFLTHTANLAFEHWDYFFGHSTKIARDRLAPIDIFHPVYPLGVDYASARWANGVARAWSQSVYAQDLIDISPHWRILVGGRYDLLAQRERVFDPLGALSGETTARVSKGVKGYFSPRAGVLFRPFDDTQLFAAFGQSIIPNIGSRLQSGEAPAPQQDTQYEIGLKQAFLDRKMTFELGLFDITRNHVAIVNPANPNGFYSAITGRQHSHGVEVNVGGEILPKLKINGAATLLHALVTKDSSTLSQVGSDLLGAPRRVYNVSANYAFDAGAPKGLELGVSYYYASRAQATIPNTYGFVLPPQQMLGASLGYSFTDKLKLDINATNLVNRPNWTSNGALFHGEPRSVSVCLSYHY